MLNKLLLNAYHFMYARLIGEKPFINYYKNTGVALHTPLCLMFSDNGEFC